MCAIQNRTWSLQIIFCFEIKSRLVQSFHSDYGEGKKNPYIILFVIFVGLLSVHFFGMYSMRDFSVFPPPTFVCTGSPGSIAKSLHDSEIEEVF